MMFRNRIEAAQLLLENLANYKGKGVIVVGIPRGAVPMAKFLSDGLQGQLTCVLVHKLPHPSNEELAIGCVGLSGLFKLSPYGRSLGLEESIIDEEVSLQLDKLKDRSQKYHLDQLDFSGKTVIIVDDGIATGSTFKCALLEIKSKNPEKIVAAVPVSSLEAFNEIKPLVDDFVCLYVSPHLSSVGQYYLSFPQVSDSEVISLLANPSTINSERLSS